MKSTSRRLKPIALSTATSLVRSRIDIAIELPATQSSEKTTARLMMRIIPLMSPSISSNILPNASSVWVRVGKSLLRYFSSISLHKRRHVVGILAPDEDHARIARNARARGPERIARAGAEHGLLQRLVEVVPANEAHPQVAVRRPVVDAPDREVQVDRVGSPFERQHVADLELLFVGQLSADHAAVLVFLERLELVRLAS